MKKQSKYDLLAKNQPAKQKNQEVWIQLQTIRNHSFKDNKDDAQYMKFQEEFSETQNDKLPLNSNKHHPNSNSNKNSKNYNQSAFNDNKNNQQRNYQKSNLNTKQKVTNNYQQHQTSNLQPNYANIQTSQMQRQNLHQTNGNLGTNQSQYYGQDSLNRQTGMYGASSNGQNFVNNNYTGRQSQMVNPQYRQSQMVQPVHQNIQSVSSQAYKNDKLPQNSSYLPAHQDSAFNSSVCRSTTRQKVPQMTVNCDKCTFSQSVPGNTQLYICCMCNQINQCFPLYGVFTCEICRANVIYPYGTSQFIKCMRCQTVNKVKTDPQKRDDQHVMLGQQLIKQKNQIQFRQEKIQKRKNQDQSSYQNVSYYNNTKNSYSNSQKPFKVISSPKVMIFEQEDISKQKPEQKRQTYKNKNQFQEELIEIDNKQKTIESRDNQIVKQILQLSQKLDQCLVIENKKQHQVNNQYPSLFE